MKTVGYGVDVTPEFETIAEATRMPDGTVQIAVVTLDKRATSA